MAQLERIDSGVMNKAARKVLGAGATIKREVTHTMADAKAVTNHYLLKTANMVEKVFWATGTTARRDICKFLDETQKFYPS